MINEIQALNTAPEFVLFTLDTLSPLHASLHVLR